MKLFAITVVATLAVTSRVVSPASASMLNYIGVGPNEVVTTHAHGLLADNLSVYAGAENLSLGGVSMTGYCVDLNQYAGSGAVDVLPVSAVHNGNLVAYLLNTYGPTATTNRSAAALGVAIWEVVNETGTTFDATTGYFFITGNAGVATDANALLATLPTSYSGGNGVAILHSDIVQDFAVPMGIGAPEPAALCLLAAGAMAITRRRRRQTV
jgi:hypothetical protein